MTPDEIELLQNAGQAILYDISMVVTQSVLYGLYLAIFTFGIRALLKRSPWTKYTWALFGFLSALCLMLTADLAVVVAFDIDLIRGYLINNPEKSLIDRFQLTDDLTAGFDTADNWLGGSGGGGGLLFIFADAVVVWRACVLWPGNKAVKVLLWTLLLASFGTAVASSTLDTISFSESSDIPASSATGVLIVLSQSLSLATNTVATMLIGYKAWYYHRRMLKSGTEMQSSKSGAILLFLTESGVAFCVLQAITLATGVADSSDPYTPLDYVSGIWPEITLFAAAAYPVLVLIIVDSHRSISDSTGGSAGDSGFAQDPNGVESHLSFAARPPGSSSSGGGIGEDSMLGSRGDPNASAEHAHEGAVRVRDLEKGGGLTAGPALSNGGR